ncbi:NAD(P)H-dependent oxidoreductase [Pirellulales bacterium]|nr:NAD(P)H-dependent oxidoreductase [Pirellulales bacterium]
MAAGSDKEIMMRVMIVSGSHRQESQSARVAEYVGNDLLRIDPTLVVDPFSLSGNPLPLWDESIWQKSSSLASLWKPIRDRMQLAHAFIFVTPEWAGMVPPGLKNLLLFAGQKEVGHKPALVVGVSAARGGSYPISELRMSGYKNNRLLIIPEHILVQDAADMLLGEKSADERDAWLRKRITFANRLLLEYGKAVGSIRASGLTEDVDFPYGM